MPARSRARTRRRTSDTRSGILLLFSVFRLIAPALLFGNVIWGIIINYAIDAVDGDILYGLGISRRMYQVYDKVMDFWLYAVLVYYGHLHAAASWLFWLFVASFVYRTVGDLLFISTGDETTLVYFPSLVIPLFLALHFYPERLLHAPGSEELLLIAFACLVILNVFKEFIMHWKRYPIGKTFVNSLSVPLFGIRLDMREPKV